MKHSNKQANQTSSPFVLPELPFDSESLEPHMSARTLSFHHGKHHATYVKNLNGLVEEQNLGKKSLEDLIESSHGKADKAGVFNNAAQVWNHSFFWHCLSPEGGGRPEGKLAEMIEKDFTSFEKFKDEFKKAAATQFGSGWAWLVEKDGKLSIVKTANAETPITDGYKALLTCDVWEHAYYLDFQNKRPDYVDTFLEKIVNWNFAEKNLG
ncbi:MAG: superoxide dismutase [Rickettsiales bacterium]